ncbi:TetR family transcriptional regulator [Streptomyces himastatinicus ATCC 53653]|uniref:TetR family transcriptional regulator n=1 Tax=Streptomyces himastatinicus ATCC 53653 TaxID=457427 RepID=D9WUQ9_9ACTN|nr:TetR/AcrR family transcriptional regulator [Streptomyces himastatinicus]EFL26441.1 TetR family transcriptional regulator [Streptomyces himastatinicus ATCC 53653]
MEKLDADAPTRRGQERRADIVRSALEVIAERGYRGATLSAVAERAGLTQQGLLHYFPTKDALLIAVLAERDQWDTGAARRDGGGAWPLELLASLVEYNAMRPGIVQTFSALLGESVTEDHPARDWFARRYERVRADMTDTLRGEFGDRLPGGLTPEAAAPLLVAVLDGLQFQWLHDPDAVDMPALFRTFVSLLGRGDEDTRDEGSGDEGSGDEGETE